MDLELSETVRDGYAVVALHGELDISNASDLRERLLAILRDQARSLVLDLSRLTFIDSTGLSVLVATERQANQLGGTLSLAGPQKIAARVLHVSGLDRHFPIFPTVDEAIPGGENDPPLAAT